LQWIGYFNGKIFYCNVWLWIDFTVTDVAAGHAPRKKHTHQRITGCLPAGPKSIHPASLLPKTAKCGKINGNTNCIQTEPVTIDWVVLHYEKQRRSASFGTLQSARTGSPLERWLAGTPFPKRLSDTHVAKFVPLWRGVRLQTLDDPGARPSGRKVSGIRYKKTRPATNEVSVRLSTVEGFSVLISG
jgi:hypothetical protein